jgi:hypothetical protein
VWLTCTFVFLQPVRSGQGSCQEAVAGGGEASPLDLGQPVSQVVHNPCRHVRATIIVPRGAHRIVQRPVEVLSPRGISVLK